MQYRNANVSEVTIGSDIASADTKQLCPICHSPIYGGLVLIFNTASETFGIAHSQCIETASREKRERLHVITKEN